MKTVKEYRGQVRRRAALALTAYILGVVLVTLALLCWAKVW